MRLIALTQYHPDLEHIFGLFPRDNFKILIFEEWTKDQKSAMVDMFRFIGCDPNVDIAADRCFLLMLSSTNASLGVCAYKNMQYA